MKNPYRAWHYPMAASAVRALEGRPVPQELLDAEKVVLDSTGIFNDIRPDDRERAIQTIREHKEHGDVLIVALNLATLYGKRNLGEANELGVELLRKLPPKMVEPTLDDLAHAVHDDQARQRLVKIQEAVSPRHEEMPRAVSE